MSATNTPQNNDPTARARVETDTEAHSFSINHLTEAGDEDTEGHNFSINHLTEAGDEDTEGHSASYGR